MASEVTRMMTAEISGTSGVTLKSRLPRGGE